MDRSNPGAAELAHCQQDMGPEPGRSRVSSVAEAVENQGFHVEHSAEGRAKGMFHVEQHASELGAFSDRQYRPHGVRKMDRIEPLKFGRELPTSRRGWLGCQQDQIALDTPKRQGNRYLHLLDRTHGNCMKEAPWRHLLHSPVIDFRRNTQGAHDFPEKRCFLSLRLG